ncbi:MAG: ArsR family transcriptional regulator [Candidatus Pacearchaeota archaeon]|jgi:predicted transcriptional regulator
MDFDLFLTSPRWEILQIIAERPSSPVEIAEKLKTTVSYVSQQLKLLDAANLLSKEKTGAAEKGKPRTLFSLSNELFYLTVLTKQFSKKKLFKLDEHHKNILKIWLIEDNTIHHLIEKLYWKLQEEISDIEGIFIDNINFKPKIIILSESKKVKLKIDSYIEDEGKRLDLNIISSNTFKKYFSEKLISLHDPTKLLEKLKGGLI